MFRTDIDFSSPLPIYRQLIYMIKLEILSGRLNDGDQLPPIRELAKILKLNPNTVAKAYYSLEEEGFITSKRGSGNWVNYKKARLDSLRKVMIEDEFKSFLERAFSLGASLGDIKNLIKRYSDND
ncbi:HTH-type transcriptional repressor YtrA [subsurface metagenome]|nr:GntR family transcriptional regulator [bacterium]TEU04658.1 MAG: GntR family transcriptional regulator [Candidatus Aminicenantes bacterium]